MSLPMIAAAALPVAMDLLMPRPAYPGGPSVGMPVMPDRSQYINQILSSGFNPQDELYRLAADQVGNEVRGHLAKMNLGGSSYGLAAMIGGQTDLANKFAAQELERRLKAMQLVNQMDQFGAQMQFNVNSANSQDAMNRFNYENQKRDAMIGGISNLAGAGANMYNMAQTRKENQANYDNLLAMMNQRYGYSGSAPAAYNGTPFNYSSPSGQYGLGFTGS